MGMVLARSIKLSQGKCQEQNRARQVQIVTYEKEVCSKSERFKMFSKFSVVKRKKLMHTLEVISFITL